MRIDRPENFIKKYYLSQTMADEGKFGAAKTILSELKNQVVFSGDFSDHMRDLAAIIDSDIAQTMMMQKSPFEKIHPILYQQLEDLNNNQTNSGIARILGQLAVLHEFYQVDVQTGLDWAHESFHSYIKCNNDKEILEHKDTMISGIKIQGIAGLLKPDEEGYYYTSKAADVAWQFGGTLYPQAQLTAARVARLSGATFYARQHLDSTIKWLSRSNGSKNKLRDIKAGLYLETALIEPSTKAYTRFMQHYDALPVAICVNRFLDVSELKTSLNLNECQEKKYNKFVDRCMLEVN